MALKILETCVNCDICTPECPNDAIGMGPEIFEIDPARCTECVGHFPESQCVVVCPVDCIVVDPDHAEGRDALWEKYRRLRAVPA